MNNNTPLPDSTVKAPLIEEEFQIFDLLADVYTRWTKLEYRHPMELGEVTTLIHALQTKLAAHAAMRIYPKAFTQPLKLNGKLLKLK